MFLARGYHNSDDSLADHHERGLGSDVPATSLPGGPGHEPEARSEGAAERSGARLFTRTL